jgi:hypothetical protein
VKKFCGEAYGVIGAQVFEGILVVGSVFPKQPSQALSVLSDLQRLVSPPLACSSYFSIAAKMMPDLLLLQEYALLAGIKGEFASTYQPSFCRNVCDLATWFKKYLNAIPESILGVIFEKDQLDVLKKFVQAITGFDV